MIARWTLAMLEWLVNRLRRRLDKRDAEERGKFREFSEILILTSPDVDPAEDTERIANAGPGEIVAVSPTYFDKVQATAKDRVRAQAAGAK